MLVGRVQQGQLFLLIPHDLTGFIILPTSWTCNLIMCDIQDENRYSVSRGAHRNLRRAERARILVSKIPDLLASVVARTKNWEDERSKVFLYDNVS